MQNLFLTFARNENSAMNFFRKSSAPKSPTPEIETAPVEPHIPADSPKLTAEEVARAWWERHTGTPMPEEVKTWLKNLARLEARKLQGSGTLLDNNGLLKLKEARRLCATKLAGTEQSIEHIREQQEWLRHFTKLNSQLEEARACLFEANKRMAVAQSSASELERFETFEAVQGRLQRILTLERALQDNKSLQTRLQEEQAEAQKRDADAQKELEQERERRTEAEKRLTLMQDTLAEGHRIGGALGILDINRTRMEAHLSTLQQEHIALQKEVAETAAEWERLTAELTDRRQNRQVLEVHQQMLEKGDVILATLDALLDTRHRREELHVLLERSLRRQDEENNLLNRLFQEYQDLEAEIHTLQGELAVHRDSNHGLDSYSLQTRAMELKRRRQLLTSALSLWRRISAGYEYLDETRQKIARMQLRVDAQSREIDTLETEVSRLRQVCNEKQYALTLSRSQNVIQLRSDLKEGTSCSVCGATHHPFHADTMLEQSKLIGEMKTDYELLDAELRSKEERLESLRLEHAAECGRLEVERTTVEKMASEHELDVNEWAPFSKLDRSFEDCSPRTNKEAREMMIKQLIEKISQDADEAQKELDTFNFHQSRINQLTEQITAKETSKNNITVRLNEVNTGCQVMTVEVEQLNNRISKLHERHSRYYEFLDKVISFKDWYKQFEEAPENLKIHLQQEMDTWQELGREITRLETQTALAAQTLENARRTLGTLDKRIAYAEDTLGASNDLYKEKSNTYSKHFGTKTVKEVRHEMLLAVNEAYLQEQQSAAKAEETRNALHAAKGACRTAQAETENLERALIEERSELDLWIRRFNANNPPVQYAELERVLSAETDRNAQRNDIRRLQTELLLAQTHVDELRAAMVAHQASGVRLSSHSEGTDAWATLIKQKDELEHRRREILSQMGSYDARLEAHEQAVEQQRLLQEEITNKLHE